MADSTPDVASWQVEEPRHRARELAVQMLYQSEVGELGISDFIETFWAQVPEMVNGLSPEALAFATELATGVTDRAVELDPLIVNAADNWRLERMHILDRIVLRIGVYELCHYPRTPTRVVINEALELARTFGSEESVRFVNGVLDAIQHQLEQS